MNKQEYEAKFHANEKITGYGMEVTMHMPCPFCAEADFMVFRIVDTEEAHKKGAICKHCGRGAKAIFKHPVGGIEFEFVQTVGDPIPDYLPPMRRVE